MMDDEFSLGLKRKLSLWLVSEKKDEEKCLGNVQSIDWWNVVGHDRRVSPDDEV